VPIIKSAGVLHFGSELRDANPSGTPMRVWGSRRSSPGRQRTAFARDLVAEELGMLKSIKRSVRVVTASGDDLTEPPSTLRYASLEGRRADTHAARGCHQGLRCENDKA
jgi:hypothetical protein